MTDQLSLRRQIENEVVFRDSNEAVQKNLEELKKIAIEESDEQWIQKSDSGFDFYCECSDENCRLRINLKPGTYKEVHNNRDQFILVPGHETLTIEKVILTDVNFIVVEKFGDTPEHADQLHVTTVDNS